MSITRRLSRRRFMRAAGIAGGGFTLPRLVFAQNKKVVHFTLPWVAEGSNLFSLSPREWASGKSTGSMSSIARGSGSVAAAQAIGAGQFDFGMCAPLGRRSCRAVKGCRWWRSPLAPMTRRWASACSTTGRSRPRKTSRESRWPGPRLRANFRSCRPSPRRRASTLAKVTGPGRQQGARPPAARGKVDAISGFASSAMPSYVATGVEGTFMLFSDYGIPQLRQRGDDPAAARRRASRNYAPRLSTGHDARPQGDDARSRPRR